MNTFYQTGIPGGGRVLDSVEQIKKQDQQLRLARIQNGADPAYKGCKKCTDLAYKKTKKK